MSVRTFLEARVRAARIVLLFVVLTMGMTYPLVTDPAQIGRVDAADARYGMWNVGWVAHQLVTSPLSLFDANIFYPSKSTLAFSEANLVAGLLGAPFYWLTGNALLAHNAVVFMAFVLNGLGAFWLVRYLTGSAPAAVLAGAAFAFCPFNFSRLAHLQLLLSAGLPIGMLALHRFVDRPSPSRGAAVGAACAVQALACGYYGIFLGLILIIASAFYAISRRRWRQRSYWGGLLLAAGVAAGLVLPFVRPYFDLREMTGFHRTLDESRQWSAGWRSYVTSPSHVHGFIFQAIPVDPLVLFPGFVPLALGGAAALVATMVARRRDGSASDRWVESTLCYGVIGSLAFWASFGPDAGLYRWLYGAAQPLMSFLREPARFGIVVALALAVLAGLGCVALQSQRRWVPAALVVLVIIETCSAPLRLHRATAVPLAHLTLQNLPPGPVAEFPFFSRRWDYPEHTIYMLYSTYHWRPLLNGYSDFIPQDFRQLSLRLERGPVAARAELLERGVRYVVVHFDFYPEAEGRELAQELARHPDLFRPVVRGVKALYELVPAS